MRAIWSIPVFSISAILAVGCGVPGDGTVESCTGSFSGVYDGSEAGLVTSVLHSTGKFVATFTMGTTERMVTAMVGTDGTISTMSGQPSISGTFGLEDCTASGMWMREGLSGNWNIEKH